MAATVSIVPAGQDQQADLCLPVESICGGNRGRDRQFVDGGVEREHTLRRC
jgi:hypothetical protein